jgi:hypothetical protein
MEALEPCGKLRLCLNMLQLVSFEFEFSLDNPRIIKYKPNKEKNHHNKILISLKNLKRAGLLYISTSDAIVIIINSVKS